MLWMQSYVPVYHVSQCRRTALSVWINGQIWMNCMLAAHWSLRAILLLDSSSGELLASFCFNYYYSIYLAAIVMPLLIEIGKILIKRLCLLRLITHPTMTYTLAVHSTTHYIQVDTYRCCCRSRMSHHSHRDRLEWRGRTAVMGVTQNL